MANAVAIEPRGVGPINFIFHQGQSVSDPQDVGGWDPIALQMPLPNWSTANVTFLAAEKLDGTYSGVYGPTGVEAMATVGTGARVVLLSSGTLADIRGLRYLKLRSGTEALAVNQAADRTVRMLVRQGA